MGKKHTYTKVLNKVKLISCRVDEFEKEANQMIYEGYEPHGKLSTVLKDGIIICTQLFAHFNEIDEDGFFRGWSPYDDEDNGWSEDDSDPDW